MDLSTHLHNHIMYSINYTTYIVHALRQWVYNMVLSQFQTLIVLSPDADTIYLSSKSTTLTAALWPTNTLRSTISCGARISHTAIVRSYTERDRERGEWCMSNYIYCPTLEHVTIVASLNRRWSTASQWWTSVFNIWPLLTSHTLYIIFHTHTHKERNCTLIK